MSRMNNGRIRSKPVREAFMDRSPYHRQGKRRSFDDSNIAYQSTPEYLRQLMNTSTISNGSTTKSLVRTSSATEMTPRSLGNPKYKAQEDYYDEIQLLKKELKYFKDDNSNLRARLRRLEEDNARKSREIEGLYDHTKDGDTRRTVTGSSTSTNSVLMNLKQRLFKLEIQLKQKETTIDTLKNDPRWTKSTELEIQNRALFNEIEKQKIERSQLIQQNYMAAIDEEKKHAVRKLEGEKQELKIENENLKKKLSDRDEQTSARRRDDSSERELHRKIDHFKGLCRKYENEIDKLKDEVKDMRRERDKYQDKFDHIKEDMQEIKRQRDPYQQKLERTNQLDGRSSPAFKRSDEYLNKRPTSGALYRDSHSPDGLSKKDSRSGTPTHSSQNLRKKNWTNGGDDDYRVEKFRRKHAATVIQRGWRQHHRTRKPYDDQFDKRNPMASPYGSRQKFGSKIDQFGSGSIRNRPTSANISTEAALKNVQAALRGHLKRNNLDKNPRTLKSQRNLSDDEDLPHSPRRQFENDRRRENDLHYSKSSFAGSRDGNANSIDKMGSNYRDSTSRFRRSPSPPHERQRPSSPRVAGSSGSKTNLFSDQYKMGSGYRPFGNDRQPPQRASSPPRDTHRSVSPYFSGSKQSLPNEKNKPGSNNRLDRESPPLRKSALNSKQSLKTISHDDDEDILGF